MPVSHGGLSSLVSDPCWDELSDDAWFAQLLDRIGLPQAAKNLALRHGLAQGRAVTKQRITSGAYA